MIISINASKELNSVHILDKKKMLEWRVRHRDRTRQDFPSSKESPCQCRRPKFNPWVGKIHWRGEWLPTPVFLPGEFHRQRSLGGLQSMGLQRVGQLSSSQFDFSLLMW